MVPALEVHIAKYSAVWEVLLKVGACNSLVYIGVEE